MYKYQKIMLIEKKKNQQLQILNSNPLIYLVKTHTQTHNDTHFPKLSNTHTNTPFQVLLGQDTQLISAVQRESQKNKKNISIKFKFPNVQNALKWKKKSEEIKVTAALTSSLTFKRAARPHVGKHSRPLNLNMKDTNSFLLLLLINQQTSFISEQEETQIATLIKP